MVSRLVIRGLMVGALLTTACGGAAKPVAHPGERTTPGIGLTVYSAPANMYGGEVWNPQTQRYEQLPAGYAIVKEWRNLELAAGRNTIRFTDVAAEIDATTVHVKSLSDAKTAVLEQNFEYDLVSAEKILGKYVGLRLVLELGDAKGTAPTQRIAGTLLSFDAGQIVLQTDDANQPVQIVQRYQNIRKIGFPALPGGLITKPTLVWILDAAKQGAQLMKVTYETGGMAWSADYTVVIAQHQQALDLAGWVTLVNHSGATYKDAELKLVAGDVNRAPVAQGQGRRARMAATETMDGEDGRDDRKGFTQKSFFEYHLYTLGRPTTLPDQSIKQLELFRPASGVPTKKVYLYYGGPEWYGYASEPYADRQYGETTSNKKVAVYLELRNDEKSGLGLPLPAGRVRVFQEDAADGSLELVGEDRIDHTPKDEDLRLKLGNAFDVVGERKQVEFKSDYAAKWIEETFEIKVRNHKDEDIEVIVRESLYRWVNWAVTAQSHKFAKKDAHTMQARVVVPKNGETVVTYTVRYTW